MKQQMLKDQRHPLSGLDTGLWLAAVEVEFGVPACKLGIEIDHKGQQALFPAAATKAAVIVWCKGLSYIVSVVTKSFIHAEQTVFTDLFLQKRPRALKEFRSKRSVIHHPPHIVPDILSN